MNRRGRRKTQKKKGEKSFPLLTSAAEGFIFIIIHVFLINYASGLLYTSVLNKQKNAYWRRPYSKAPFLYC